MEKKFYMLFYVLLLVGIISIFYMQIKHLSDWQQWMWLLAIVIVGLLGWLMGKKMKKEAWFIAQGTKS